MGGYQYGCSWFGFGVWFDVIGILTDQPDSRRAAKYWSVLKIRIKRESNELTTICGQLKLKSSDGKRYNTDVANTEQLLRIIQSIFLLVKLINFVQSSLKNSVTRPVGPLRCLATMSSVMWLGVSSAPL